AAHEVRPLVAVETDAVSGAMREAGHFIVGTEAGVGDHLARGCVDRGACRPYLRRLERRALRALLELPHVALALRGFAEHRRARDVRRVALDGAAGVNEDDVALPDLLRLDAAMRKR